MANILVVDDDDQMRKLIRLLLQREGHSVVEASDGLEALRLLDAGPVDLVVSDVVMPDMDGLELIRKARKAHPGLRILAVSGAGQEGPGLYLELAGRFGADAVLLKPFERVRLIEEIARLLGA
jgi:CheY-like chemotaxis protein